MTRTADVTQSHGNSAHFWSSNWKPSTTLGGATNSAVGRPLYEMRGIQALELNPGHIGPRCLLKVH